MGSRLDRAEKTGGEERMETEERRESERVSGGSQTADSRHSSHQEAEAASSLVKSGLALGLALANRRK